MPSGTAISVAPSVTSNVPTIAGPMPGPGMREMCGISAVKNAGKPRNATLAPRETTDHRTAKSGIATTTTAAPITPSMILFLIDRHDGRERRSSAIGVTADRITSVTP